MANLQQSPRIVNRTVVVFCVLALAGIGRAATNQPPTTSKLIAEARIFRAICLWEHRGVIRPDDVSKAGAVGPAQIRQIFLDDANEYLGTSFTLEDCKDYVVAFTVTRAYWRKYNLKTDEQRARAHYGGPRGPQRPCTLEYWQGVQTYLR